MIEFLKILGDLFDVPLESRAQGFGGHCPAGFTDGSQSAKSPLFRVVLFELAHEQAVRHHGQRRVPCLPPATYPITGEDRLQGVVYFRLGETYRIDSCWCRPKSHSAGRSRFIRLTLEERHRRDQ